MNLVRFFLPFPPSGGFDAADGETFLLNHPAPAMNWANRKYIGNHTINPFFATYFTPYMVYDSVGFYSRFAAQRLMACRVSRVSQWEKPLGHRGQRQRGVAPQSDGNLQGDRAAMFNFRNNSSRMRRLLRAAMRVSPPPPPPSG